MSIRSNYNHTLNASYLAYITQAIINNFAPLLFLTFQSTYQLTLDKITWLVTLNFLVQLLVDFISIKFVDKIGYRISIVFAHIFAGAGLIGLGLLPEMFADPYVGLLLAIIIYAIGGGIIEVLISPIVEACPTERKSAAMSLLHSFYCWGHVFVILGSTFYFIVIGIENWKFLAIIWAMLPLMNAVYFSIVPITSLEDHETRMPVRKLISMKMFWVFVLLMICAGASEQAMSQWVSAFAESGLKVSKTVGDLAGPCFFAIMMGTSRVFYSKYSEKIHLEKFMLGSGILCIFSYLLAVFSPNALLALIGCGLSGLAVGILWPGTFSLAALKLRSGGTAMFALLALAGDLGCSFGPSVVGFVSESYNDNLKAGLFAAIIFPILLIVGLWISKRVLKKQLVPSIIK